MLTQKILKDTFHYDADTGHLTWLKGPKKLSRAGTVDKDRGYRMVFVKGKKYREHRLIWFMVHGEWPEQVDHINRIKDDNRLSNLRDVNNFDNSQNQSWEVQGIYKSSGQWVACLGDKYCRRFSIETHGEEAAKALAIQAREFFVILHRNNIPL